MPFVSSWQEAAFICGACCRRKAAAVAPHGGRCGSTLIVCPAPILDQWLTEIHRHLKPGALKVLVYRGQPPVRLPLRPLSLLPSGLSLHTRPTTRRLRKHPEKNDEDAPVLTRASRERTRLCLHRRELKAGRLTATIKLRIVTCGISGERSLYGAGPQGASLGGDPTTVYSAADMAAADIVLTTYDVLRADIHHDPSCPLDATHPAAAGPAAAPPRVLRGTKRYKVLPTPLTRLHWWRVCVDEAQLVESSTAAAAAMARLLPCTHCWAVTGTPISRGLEDLFGLLSFLRASPWEEGCWWRQALQAPFEAGEHAPLLRALRPLLWRNSKTNVAAELGLPPQAEHTTTLRLSAVEAHFYRRQHAACAADATKALPEAARHSAPDRALSTAEAKKVLLPLLKLRQACCHPQVGASGVRSLAQRTPMSMAEILSLLVARTTTEAEDALRSLVSSLNGLGALFQIQQQPADAVAAYREAAAAWSLAQLDGIRADPLLRLHTLANLHELLEGFPALGGAAGRVGRTLRDHQLSEQAEEVRVQYRAPRQAELAAAEADLKAARDAVSRHRAALRAGGGENWWLGAMAQIAQRADGGAAFLEAVLDKITPISMRRGVAAVPLWQGKPASFRSVHGLRLVMQQDLEAAHAAAGHVAARLVALGALGESEREAEEHVQRAAHCHRCRAEMGRVGVLCQYCQAEDEVFNPAELRLMGVVGTSSDAHRSHLTEGGELVRLGENQGRLQPLSAEVVLSMLPRAAGSARAAGDAATHLCAVLDARRREFTAARRVLQAQRMLVYAHDELAMSGLRIQLRAPSEMPPPGRADPVPEHERRFRIFAADAVPLNVENTLNKVRGRVARTQPRVFVALTPRSRSAEPAGAARKSRSRETALPKTDSADSSTRSCPMSWTPSLHRQLGSACARGQRCRLVGMRSRG
jgi:E3 ubiquitin-protein ligase SHPRH